MATKLSDRFVGLDVNEDGSISVPADMIEEVTKKVTAETYNKDYAERSRHALAVLKSRHQAEYNAYLEFLKTNPKLALVESLARKDREVASSEEAVNESNNRGGRTAPTS